ncbi:MAG: terminase, partial [Bacteroidales bacterium]
MTTAELIEINSTRVNGFTCEYDRLTGEGADDCERFRIEIEDFVLPTQWLPISMRDIPLVELLIKHGSIEEVLNAINQEVTDENLQLLINSLIRLRCAHDFQFWAYSYVRIKDKKGGGNIPFALNRPQRKVLAELERMRLAEQPIRMIILKARQWGGSTLVQMYMAWIQLVHKSGYYSAIIAHQTSASKTIRAMYSKMIREYPPELLGADDDTPLALTPYEGSHSDVTITQRGNVVRDSVICIGSMQTPDSIRGGDIALAHMSEVGMWRETLGKSPEDVIRSVSSSILLAPLTMDVMESTANGENNLFHSEWIAAKSGDSLRRPVFVAWFEIENYQLPFASDDERLAFAQRLITNKDIKEIANDREEAGAYLWYLWSSGATLEAINWYVNIRRNYNSHHAIASEYPSDDIEAFSHSGSEIFDRYAVERLRETCRTPIAIGDVSGDSSEGKQALQGLHFNQRENGALSIWEHPDKDIDVSNRYLVVTDVGGRALTSDYSCITVIDRYWLMYGDNPVIVAQWYGHCRHDQLAWKMAQIAEYYNHALLVVESNTYETHNTEGEHSDYILDQIANV